MSSKNNQSIHKSKLAILMIAIFLITNINLAYAETVPIANTNEEIAKMSIEDKIKKASVELAIFFQGTDQTQMVIIVGERISIEDKLLFQLVQSQVTEVSLIPSYKDLEVIANPKIVEGKTVILLGGERTNHYSKKLMEENILKESTESNYDPVNLRYGLTNDGNKILFAYSQKEIINHENRAVKVSPLNNFMEQKYVPIAATLFSIIMLSLWNLLYNTLTNLFADYSSNKITDKLSKKKMVSEKKKNHYQKTLRVHQLLHKGEVIALIISIIVFAAMLAWSWTDTMNNYLNMFLISIVIVAILGIMKEYIRQKFCYTRKIHVEFIFWPFGTILTAISTYLGNTFSLASYGLVEENQEDEKNFGKIAFITSLFTLLIALSAYIANIIYPSIILQLVYVYAILAAFIDMFPMNPMVGNDIKKWNFTLWILMYIIIIACYIFMSFTQYI